MTPISFTVYQDTEDNELPVAFNLTQKWNGTVIGKQEARSQGAGFANA
jgi:hypothetical protein